MKTSFLYMIKPAKAKWSGMSIQHKATHPVIWRHAFVQHLAPAPVCGMADCSVPGASQATNTTLMHVRRESLGVALVQRLFASSLLGPQYQAAADNPYQSP